VKQGEWLAGSRYSATASKAVKINQLHQPKQVRPEKEQFFNKLLKIFCATL